MVRHDEQEDEAHFDERSDADDDVEKGAIKFSHAKLYGREKELAKLHALYDRLRTTSMAQVVFIPGYSGTGKSALVNEFIQQLERKFQIDPTTNTSINNNNNSSNSSSYKKSPSYSPWFISGKYEEMQSPYPFSAIVDGLNKFCSWIVSQEGLKSDVEQMKENFRQFVGTGNLYSLTELIPDLQRIVGTISDHSSSSLSGGGKSSLSTLSNAAGGEKKSIHRVQQLFRTFMLALSSKNHPLILFLDDLQWCDAGSLDLLSILLFDSKLENVLFIGSFRSNEVPSTHAVSIFMREVQKHRSCGVSNMERLELSDLSQDDLGDFIADTLDLSPSKVVPLTDAIYSKTLGNMFFAMQALEELVRKNALFYNVMTFTWDWNLSQVDLVDLLSDDVVAMVQSKIEHAPSMVQTILTTASFTRSTFTVETLQRLLADVLDITMTGQELVHVLDGAVTEGLLKTGKSKSSDITTMHSDTGGIEYAFAHDRIQEASIGLVTGDNRHQLCLDIAETLVRWHTSGEVGDDWILFVAVHHLNSLPSQYHRHPRHNHHHDPRASGGASNNKTKGFTGTELASLNLQAAKSAILKSAFAQAVELLRAGVRHLNNDFESSTATTDTPWTEQYTLILDIHNHLLETEFSVGNHVLAQKSVDEILIHAASNQDKCLAQVFALEILMKERNYAEAVPKALEYLSGHGIHLQPNPGQRQLVAERVRLQLVQRNRKISEIMDLPFMEESDECVMWLMGQLSMCAAVVNENLATATILVAQKISWEKGINRHLPVMMSHLSIFTRKNGKFKEAYKLGKLTLDMLNRVCVGASWCKGMNSVAGCVLLLRSPFKDSLDMLNEAYRVGIAAGDIEWGLLAAMQYCHTYFCTGSPTNAIFEPKVILFEDEARRLSQPPSVTVTFSIFRQTLLNLQGKGNPNPALLKGNAVDEEEAVAKFEGNTQKQTIRDFGIFRLLLACIFNDLDCQRQMVDRLVEYPDFDFTIPRQHLRDTFVGLAAFHLGRKLKDKKYTTIGRRKQHFFQKLSNTGSVIAPPVLLCMKAMEKPSVFHYTIAIDACAAESLLHLQAMMNEHCGLFLAARKKDGDEEEAKQFLKRALWIYFDWGAMGKVAQMRQQHQFLHGCRRSEHTPNALLNFMSAYDSGSSGSMGMR
jgi:histidine kinase